MVLFSSLQNAVLPLKKNQQNNNQHRNNKKKNLYKYHIYNLAKNRNFQERSSLQAEYNRSGSRGQSFCIQCENKTCNNYSGLWDAEGMWGSSGVQGGSRGQRTRYGHERGRPTAEFK